MKYIAFIVMCGILTSCIGKEKPNGEIKDTGAIAQEHTTTSGSLLGTTDNLQTKTETMKKELQNGDVVASVKTNNGTFKIRLETEKAPITSANFIGLAKKGYYNDVIFHRIIKDFMIQGGDPDGTGMGGESIYGEKFSDEFHPELKNTTFTISMANSGKNTNGSQFFINVANNSHLDQKHSVFGEVVEGTDTITKLSKVKTGAGDRPEKEVKIIGIKVQEYENGAFKEYTFDEQKAISEYNTIEEEKANAVAEKGDTVAVHYTGTFKDGKKFDSSYDRNQPLTFVVGSGQMIPGFDAAVVGMKKGEKKSITLAPSEAYGEIKENATQELSFEQIGVTTEEQKAEVKKGGKLYSMQGEVEILEVTNSGVVIDINHPLAGKTLKFDIEMVSVEK